MAPTPIGLPPAAARKRPRLAAAGHLRAGALPLAARRRLGGGTATAGETATAKVRVGKARPRDVYRLLAKASRADVQILGASEQIVHGSTPASFRFTSISTGPGGIAVGVEKLEARDRRLP